MSKLPIPSRSVEDIYKITPEFLREQGIKFLLMDLDNTLSPYIVDDATQELKDWNTRENVKGARVNLYLGKRFRNLFQDLKISETAKNAIGVEDEDDDAVVNP